eukprot:11836401-Alexandrium_andersonii.AAC.1
MCIRDSASGVRQHTFPRRLCSAGMTVLIARGQQTQTNMLHCEAFVWPVKHVCHGVCHPLESSMLHAAQGDSGCS